MLGRLARYLRFLGCDTAWERGLGDEEIARRAAAEGRVVVTRDRGLAARSPGAILLRAPHVGEQLRELAAACPGLPREVAFDRCPECNGRLGRWRPPDGGPWPDGVPRERVDSGLPVFECPECRRRFWEGSHTVAIRRSLATWLPAVPP